MRSDLFSFLILLFSLCPNVELSAREPNRSDTLDVTHYDIRLNITNMLSKSIDGYTTLYITPTNAAINHVNLDLLHLTPDSIFVGQTNISNFGYNDTLLQIPLTAPVNPGDTIDVTVYYHGQPVMDPSGWGGFYFSSDGQSAYNLGVGFADVPHVYGRVWFPCIDVFTDQATYDCHIRVDSGKTAVCGGMLQNVQNNGDGTQTYFWRLSQPIPTYLASVAVGVYVAVEGTYSGINEVIPTFLYVLPSDTTKARASFVHLNDILALYELHFGPYQWDRVGFVSVPFNSGAMEHATNIAYPRATIDGSLAYETLWAHELFHHWFGDLITCEKAEEMWINEGWASFSEAFVLEYLYSRKDAIDHLRKLNHSVIQLAHVNEGYLALSNVPQEFTYGTHSYDKGEVVVHSLRGFMGDSLFFSSVKSMLDQYKFSNINSEEMGLYLEQQSGLPVTDFFDAWVMQPGYVHFNVDSFRSSSSGSDYLVDVYLRQKRNHKPVFADNNRVEITFMDENWQKHTELASFSGQTGHVQFIVPINPVCVMADLYEKICDATTDNYSTISQTGLYEFPHTYFTIDPQQLPDSAFVRVTHNWVRPEGFRTPHPGVFLSVNRYWKIESVVPDGFHAKGKFRYSKMTGASTLSQLDNELITNSIDSLLLFYRPNAGTDWQQTSFVRSGTTNLGYLIADTILPGEYAFAIRDWDCPLDTVINHDTLINPDTLGIKKTGQLLSPALHIFPNPTSGTFTVEFASATNRHLEIADLTGRKVKNISIPDSAENLELSMKSFPPGSYVVSVFTEHKKLQSGILLLTSSN
ncbi:MAG: T9SS type A sorting domain-containing protein [Bacteroidetes bacterium]|nr:T9SS type A sorting domain-containing protein [Bacteroidota bacterium]